MKVQTEWIEDLIKRKRQDIKSAEKDKDYYRTLIAKLDARISKDAKDIVTLNRALLELKNGEINNGRECKCENDCECNNNGRA